MKNNKIELKFLFFIVALIFNCTSVAIGDKLTDSVCPKASTILLDKENRGICSYKVNENINYLLLDKFKFYNASTNFDSEKKLIEVNDKEGKYISLLIPARKKLLVDFNDSDSAKITSNDLLIKNINFIKNDCVSFLDIYQKIISVYSGQQTFKTFDDCIACRKYIMSEILIKLKKEQTLLFLPVLIPAIIKLEKHEELLPLAYIDSIAYNYEDPSEIVFTLTVPQIHDKFLNQGFSQESYIKSIASKIPIESLPKNKAKYRINLSTGNSTFELMTIDDMDIKIKEDL